ncbi:MAG: AAA family ATPase [Lachnospiraceae bacterium]|nr:AAA family ATPase [Lachnospiraceae bacterium]
MVNIKTKRFLYGVLKNTVCLKNGCHAVIGARRVGKTVLFLQLNEDFGSEADYFDCTALLGRGRDDFDFEKYYQNAVESGKRIIFLDETCKLGIDYLAHFIQYTRLYSANLCILITGSVAAVVKKQVYEIGRGTYFSLPPFMYIERLCWSQGVSEIDPDCIREGTSDALFKDYLKNQIMSEREFLGYMRGVAEDTLGSYREHTFLEDSLDMPDDVLINALKYVSLCQFVYKKDSGAYIDLPSIEKKLRDKVFEDYSAAKSKWGLSSADIDNAVNLLLGCALARRSGYYKGHSISFEEPLLSERRVPSIIFEYPWFTSIFLSPDIQNSSAMLNQWVKYSILLRASYIYQYVYKYRSNDSIELDVVYMTEDFNAIEVKNRPYKNNPESYILSARRHALDAGISEFLITSSDSSDRNDKLAACMELEYIDILNSGLAYSRNTASELEVKFGMT